MHFEPAIPCLAIALLCSLVGRILLFGAAFSKGTAWGLLVLFVPFGPTVFRLKNRELAHPTRYWRMAVGPMMLLFFATGGSVDSFQSLSPGKLASIFGKKEAPSTVPVTPAPALTQATPQPAAIPAATPAIAKATPAPKTTPAPVAAAKPAMTLEEAQQLAMRIEANQHEMERLAEWYDTLKHERGYLRKNDADAINAYNDEAAKYQTAVAAAKLEQANIARVTAKK